MWYIYIMSNNWHCRNSYTSILSYNSHFFIVLGIIKIYRHRKFDDYSSILFSILTIVCIRSLGSFIYLPRIYLSNCKIYTILFFHFFLLLKWIYHICRYLPFLKWQSQEMEKSGCQRGLRKEWGQEGRGYGNKRAIWGIFTGMEMSCISTVTMSMSWSGIVWYFGKMLPLGALGRSTKISIISYNWMWIYNYFKNI